MDDDRWCAGLTLAERRAAASAVPPSLTADDLERGALRLGLWSAGRLVPGAPVSLLDPNGPFDIAEDELTVLLGETTRSLRNRLPERPAWLQTLLDAWPGRDAPSDSSIRACWCGGVAEEDAALDIDAACLRWIEPLVIQAQTSLASRIRNLLPDFGSPARPLLDHPILRPDQPTLRRMVKRVLVLELNVARVRGELCGDSPRKRQCCFLRGIARPVRALNLLAEYPVLARELVAHMQQWADVRFEFIARLHADAEELTSVFGVELPGGKLLDDVEFDAGDRHRNGRTVAIVHVGKHRLVYKPRSMGIDQHFSEIISWLNEQGIKHALHSPTVLNRGSYGWTSFVEHGPCADEDALCRFYWRHGAHLALFHLLRAYDLHMYNVVAAGEHPVFVDLETMFHAPAPFEELDDDYPAWTAIRESVLATLMLPRPKITSSADGARSTDLSGLTGGINTAQDRSIPTIDFANESADTVHVVRGRKAPLTGANLPYVTGSVEEHRVRADMVAAGFEDCYRLLLDRRGSLMAEEGPLAAFVADQVRSVLRDTSTYRVILSEIWHPDLLRDGLDWEHFLSVLASRESLNAYPEIVRSERRQLARHDIPVFELQTSSTDLFDPAGLTYPDFVPASGMACVRQRLDKLSVEDCNEQKWFIQASLAPFHDTRIPIYAASAEPRHEVTSPVDLDVNILADAATSIADRLVDTALSDEPGTGAEWLSLNQHGDAYAIGPTGLDLFSGITGILTFLTELESALGRGDYRPFVENAARSLFSDDDPPEVEDLLGMPAGAYQDLGSVVHLATRLHSVWPDLPVLHAFNWLIPAIEQNIANDPAVGCVIDGVVGAGLALVHLHRVESSIVPAELIRAIGRRAIADLARFTPSVGFGQGLSGYAYALAVLADVTGDESLLEAARAAIGQERALLIARPTDAPVSWSDGWAGVVIARAGLLAMPACASWEDELRRDMEHGLDAIRRALMSRDSIDRDNDSLYDGRLGMIEAMVLAAGTDPVPELATDVANEIAADVLHGTVRTGLPVGVWNPGLLQGAAGIGYGLLRLTAPQKVPRILLPG